MTRRRYNLWSVLRDPRLRRYGWRLLGWMLLHWLSLIAAGIYVLPAVITIGPVHLVDLLARAARWLCWLYFALWAALLREPYLQNDRVREFLARPRHMYRVVVDELQEEIEK